MKQNNKKFKFSNPWFEATNGLSDVRREMLEDITSECVEEGMNEMKLMAVNALSERIEKILKFECDTYEYRDVGYVRGLIEAKRIIRNLR